jgi:predicted nucleic acid-binding protein
VGFYETSGELMANKLRRYWDAGCCFGYLWDQAGRADDCERSLIDAEEGNCEIVISALTIAEVLHLKGDKRRFSKESRDAIRGFFRRSIFLVVDVDRFIAEHAQDVFWEHDIMPKDAVHVATALASEAHYLETFDKVLLGKTRQLGGDPQLVVQIPATDLGAKLEARKAKLLSKPQGALELGDGLHGPLSS